MLVMPFKTIYRKQVMGSPGIWWVMDLGEKMHEESRNAQLRKRGRGQEICLEGMVVSIEP